VQHQDSPKTEGAWLAYLKAKGYDPITYCYGDYLGTHEKRVALDISQYLKQIPLLTSKPRDVKLPDKFITVQWDANGPRRSIHWRKRKVILRKYQDQGYTPVIVGGEAKTEELRWSLAHIAHAMSHAELHVGVDSAFMHLAQLYMPYDRIHLYSEPDTKPSHHLLRAVDNGARLNCFTWNTGEANQ